MRRTRRLDLLAAVLLGLCGCTTTDQQVQPPEMPEEFRSPPPEDRYTGPPKFPRETLNQDQIRRPDENGTPAPGGPGSPGNPRGGSGPIRGPAPGPSYN